jgi:hypothetical protein
MVYLRRALLGLGLVSAFTGISYGQILCPSGGPGTYQIQPGLAANLLRVEGLTEEVADLNIYCQAGSTLATGTLTVTLNAQVTSKGVGGTTDALLSIATNNNVFGGPAAPPTITSTPVLYYGMISAGSQTVVFSNVNFPAGSFTMTIQNIRVNASQLPVTPGANQVNESVLVTNAGVGIFAPSSQLVGLVYQGFKAAAVSGVANWLMCKSSPQGAVPQITISELFGGAFKSTWPQGQTAASTVLCGALAAPCTSTNGENGTGNAAYFAALGGGAPPPAPDAQPFRGRILGAPAVPAAGTGLATHGTRFQIAFGNIPAGVTLTVPVTPTGTAITGGTANFTMQLVASPTGVYAPLASGVLATTAAGTAVAYYEVIATDNTIQLESIDIFVSPGAAANFSVNPAGPITAVVTVAPQIPLSTTSDVPDFSTPTPAPLNLTTWSLCQTTLLFPFVSTNGVETAVAMSNTSLDPGKIGGGGVLSTASPNQGSCTLNFYGTLAAAPSTAVSYLGVAAPNPTLPAGGGTPYTQPAGTSNAFVIGAEPSNNMTGLVPAGFSGYLIAQCNYLYGHGFTYISYQLGGPNGATEGYTALVLNNRPITAGAPTIVSEILLQ